MTQITRRAKRYSDRFHSPLLLIAMLAFSSVTANAQISSPTDLQTKEISETASKVGPQPSAIAPPAPLAMLSMPGLRPAGTPRTFDAGPFGELNVTGILSGFVHAQNNSSSGDRTGRTDISNGQISIQKTSGLVQYFLQAGIYSTPSLGTPGLSTGNTISHFYGPLPHAYLKLAPKKDISLLIGKLPTLFGAEYTFTYENLNIERGLLWNQENVVNRGVQVNYGKGKLSSSFSWNDGFYSNRYNWLTGTSTYAFSAANSLQFVAGGNLGCTAYSSMASPLYQNNSSIYNLIYIHIGKRWMIEPYVQYSRVSANERLGVGRTSATLGGALLGNYVFTPHLSLAGRAEYIRSTGNRDDGSANLLYGPGSRAWSITLTPAYQDKAFFARAEFSVSHANNYAPGDAFGPNGIDSSQVRGLIEAGFMF